MMLKHLAKDIGIICLILFIVSTISLVLFFCEGGQIWGINDNIETIPNPMGQTIDGVTIRPGNPDIEPIDDGTKIVPVEIWQLPPRDILLHLITRPMVYIPPIFSDIIVILYAALGLTFFVLYRRKNTKQPRDANSRQEIIYQTICKTPGISQQMIVDKTGFSRSSVRHHLTILLNNLEIVTVGGSGHSRYIANKKIENSQSQMLAISLAEKKNSVLLLELWKRQEAKISELAEATGQHQSTTRWRVQKLEKRGLIRRKERNGISYYSLEETTAEDLAEIFCME